MRSEIAELRRSIGMPAASGQVHAEEDVAEEEEARAQQNSCQAVPPRDEVLTSRDEVFNDDGRFWQPAMTPRFSGSPRGSPRGSLRGSTRGSAC